MLSTETKCCANPNQQKARTDPMVFALEWGRAAQQTYLAGRRLLAPIESMGRLPAARKRVAYQNVVCTRKCACWGAILEVLPFHWHTPVLCSCHSEPALSHLLCTLCFHACCPTSSCVPFRKPCTVCKLAITHPRPPMLRCTCQHRLSKPGVI